MIAVIAVAGMASAYSVFHNATTRLPVNVSFFWFSFFAMLASFLFPSDMTGAILARGLSIGERLEKIYPQSPWRQWIDSLKCGGHRLLTVTAAFHILYFALLLTSLQLKQTNVALTVLLIGQTEPLLMSFLGYKFLGDTCRNWFAFVIGSLVTASGIVIYKFSKQMTLANGFFDTVVILSLAAIAMRCVSTIARTKYRRVNKVDALDAMRSVQVAATVFGLLWTLLSGNSFSLNKNELTGLIYLGFIPTAICGILYNRTQDVIGIPAVMSIGSMRPILLILIGFIPYPWFAINLGALQPSQYLGIAVAVSGLLINIWIAKPQPVETEK